MGNNERTTSGMGDTSFVLCCVSDTYNFFNYFLRFITKFLVEELISTLYKFFITKPLVIKLTWKPNAVQAFGVF